MFGFIEFVFTGMSAETILTLLWLFPSVFYFLSEFNDKIVEPNKWTDEQTFAFEIPTYMVNWPEWEIPTDQAEVEFFGITIDDLDRVLGLLPGQRTWAKMPSGCRLVVTSERPLRHHDWDVNRRYKYSIVDYLAL